MKSTLLVILLGIILCHVAISQNCSSQVPNCATCFNNGTSCANCIKGFIQYEGVCRLCNISSCKQCKEDGKCYECNAGFTLVENKCFSCSIDKCAFCIDNNFCGQCKNVSDTYYPTANGDKCVKCAVTNCLKCSADNSCGKCSNGYVLYPERQVVGGTRKCITCNVNNCLDCKENEICQNCAPGYQNKDDGTCFLCRPPCRTCNPNNTCISCVSPMFYAIPALSGGCFRSTIANCNTYDLTNTTKCTQCLPQFTYNSTTNRCAFLCSSSCLTCSNTNTTTCLSCPIGYFLQDGKCLTCSIGCDACSSVRVCTLATKGFFLESNQTRPCRSYCKVCQSATICTQLTQTQGSVIIVNQKNETVLAVCASNCDKCSSANVQVCIICKQGYFNNLGTCKTCDLICRTCESNSASVCISCYPNTFKTGNTCASCDANCLTCESGAKPKVCTSCPTNYFLSTQKVCIQGCPSDCLECSNATTCTKCASGFTIFEDTDFSPSSKICLGCISTCRVCAGGQPATCLECGNGLYSVGGKCQSCSSQCQACTSRGCGKCNDGFFLTQSLTCAKNCNLPCSSCLVSDPDGCKSCVAGYSFNSVTGKCDPSIVCNGPCSVCPFGYALLTGACVKCTKPNCQKCNPTGVDECNSCIRGYYLTSDSSCTKCPASCTQCATATICSKCAEGFVAGQKKGKGFPCNQCQGRCATCTGKPNKCSSCKQGSSLDGWKCVNDFKIDFKVKFDIPFKQFGKKIKSFLIFFALAMGSKDTNAVTFNNIFQGSVNVDAVAQPTGVSGSTGANTQFNNLASALQSGTIDGMPIQGSSFEVKGGTTQVAPDVTPAPDGNGTSPSPSSSNLGIILGICIPLGILIIIGVVLFIVYRNKSRDGSKYDSDKQSQYNGGEYQRKGDSTGKVVIYEDNSLI